MRKFSPATTSQEMRPCSRVVTVDDTVLETDDVNDPEIDVVAVEVAELVIVEEAVWEPVVEPVCETVLVAVLEPVDVNELEPELDIVSVRVLDIVVDADEVPEELIVELPLAL